MFTFPNLDWKYPFWTNCVQKSKLFFKVKFGTEANSNMQNSVGMFTFSVFN